jgi:hypothetical protein
VSRLELTVATKAIESFQRFSVFLARRRIFFEGAR